MGHKPRLTLDERVSVFKHNGGIYLFDPATHTCASMNESMSALVTNPHGISSCDELVEENSNSVGDVIKQLHRLGILIEEGKTCRPDSMPKTLGLMTHLTIFVTTRCNLRCAYCYARGGDTQKTIGKETWRIAMDYFFAALDSELAKRDVGLKNVTLTIHGGGEPTLEFDILKEIVAEFCDRARALGLRPNVGMGTNGTYGDAVHQWIVDNNITVNISLDGPRDIQNHLRPFRSGQPSYDVVEHNLKRLVETGRPVSVRATITEQAVETMEETVELAKRLGLAAVNFQPVTLTGRGTNGTVSRPDAELFTEKFLKCFLLGLRYDINVKYSGMRCFEPYHHRFCSACGQNFCVTPDGNITTCYEVLGEEDPASSIFFIGKINSDAGQVELNQLRIDELKQRVTVNMEACKDCFLRYQCAGDCPIKSFRYSNRDLYSPDPYRCRIADKLNKQLIAWLADGVIEPRGFKHARVTISNPTY